MTKKKSIISIILALFMALITLFSVFVPTAAPLAVSASTSAYSDVLDDLKKDVNFTVENYPANAEKDIFQVVQIAESTANELLVYVYCSKNSTFADGKMLYAREIVISQTVYGDESYRRYNLTLLSENGVFSKYRVEDFTIEVGDVRYYDITEIFRDYDSDLDGENNSASATDGIAYPVGQLWKACTIDGNVTYSMVTTEIMTLTNQWFGSVSYSEGYFGSHYYANTDVWFVIIKPDRPIEHLMEVDITYAWTSYCHEIGVLIPGEETRVTGSNPNQFKLLNDAQKIDVEGNGLFGATWTWDRIVAIDDFVNDNSENMTEELKNELLLNDYSGGWLLRFAETTNENYDILNFEGMISSHNHIYTDISNVAVLRLKYKTDGVIYNIGVVANSGDPDGVPDVVYDTLDGIKKNLKDFFDGFWDNLMEMLLQLLFGFILLFVIIKGLEILLGPAIGAGMNFVFHLILEGFKLLFKAIFFLLTLPFQLLFGRKRRRNDKK